MSAFQLDKNPAKADHDVWVLAGQSNMQGCGWLENAMTKDDRVWSFTSAGKWQPAEEPLHRLWESFTPVHQDLMRVGLLESEKALTDEELRQRDSEAPLGAGLGLSFGSAMADQLGRPIGLIPAAHGGTSLEQWSPDLKGKGGRSLYGAMLERIERAGGRLKGVLWYQGESDSLTADLGRTYSERIDRWIESVRADTGIDDLPVIAVQIGRLVINRESEGAWRGWNMVQEAIRTVPDRLSNTEVTSAIDLPLTDAIHISTEGLVRLGRRLARLALVLTEKSTIPRGPTIERAELVTTSAGLQNGIRLRFRGLAGAWADNGPVRGFSVRQSDWEEREPLNVVNAWIDRDTGDGTDIMVLLNREPEPNTDVSIGYGLGYDPACILADEADMPLCGFSWQQIG